MSDITDEAGITSLVKGLMTIDFVVILLTAVLLVHLYVVISNVPIIHQFLWSKTQRANPETPSSILSLSQFGSYFTFYDVFWTSLYNNNYFNPERMYASHFYDETYRGWTYIEQILFHKSFSPRSTHTTLNPNNHGHDEGDESLIDKCIMIEASPTEYPAFTPIPDLPSIQSHPRPTQSAPQLPQSSHQPTTTTTTTTTTITPCHDIPATPTESTSLLSSSQPNQPEPQQFYLSKLSIALWVICSSLSLLMLYYFRPILILIVLAFFIFIGFYSLHTVLYLYTVHLASQPIYVPPSMTPTQFQHQNFNNNIHIPKKSIFAVLALNLTLFLRQLYQTYLIHTTSPLSTPATYHVPYETSHILSDHREHYNPTISPNSPPSHNLFFTTSTSFFSFPFSTLAALKSCCSCCSSSRRQRKSLIAARFFFVNKSDIDPLSFTPSPTNSPQRIQSTEQQQAQPLQPPTLTPAGHITNIPHLYPSQLVLSKSNTYNTLSLFCAIVAFCVVFLWSALLISAFITHIHKHLVTYDIVFDTTTYHSNHLITSVLTKPFATQQHPFLFSILQNIICAAIILNIARSMPKINSFKLGAGLLIALMAYDIFWVFISPHFFSSSVMVQVATGSAEQASVDPLEQFSSTSTSTSTSTANTTTSLTSAGVNSILTMISTTNIPSSISSLLPEDAVIQSIHKSHSPPSIIAWLKILATSIQIPMLLHFPRVSILKCITTIIDYAYSSISPAFHTISHYFPKHILPHFSHHSLSKVSYGILGLGDIMLPAIFLSWLYGYELQKQFNLHSKTTKSPRNQNQPPHSQPQTHIPASQPNNPTTPLYGSISTEDSSELQGDTNVSNTNQTNPSQSLISISIGVDTTIDPNDNIYPPTQSLCHLIQPRSLQHDLTNDPYIAGIISTTSSTSTSTSTSSTIPQTRIGCTCSYTCGIFSSLLSSLFPNITFFQAKPCSLHSQPRLVTSTAPSHFSYYSISLLSYFIALLVCEVIAMSTKHGQPALFYIVPAILLSTLYTAYTRDQLDWLLETNGRTTDSIGNNANDGL